MSSIRMGRDQTKTPKTKTPKVYAPPFEKVPRTSPATNGKIRFRFDHIDPDGDWGWRRLTTGCVQTIGRKLPNLETMTWVEATASGTVGVKDIPVANIIRAAQRRLAQMREHADVGDLWEVRLGNTERLWGVRVGDVCQLLWWDPEHKVCPSTKIGNSN